MGSRNSKSVQSCNVATSSKIIGQGSDSAGTFNKYKSDYTKHKNGRPCKAYSREWNDSPWAGVGA